MDQTRYLWMPCTIENSGFSSERRFEVDLQGAGEVVGAAYIKYFRDEAKQELPEGHPPYGQSLQGFVQCRIVRVEDHEVFIEFPGTEVFHVPQEALAETW